MKGDLKTVAFFLDLKRSGAEYKGRCPLCGGTDRFHIKQGRQHDLIVHCRYGCRFKDIASYLKQSGMIDDDRETWATIEEDKRDIEALLRAFIADIDRGNTPSSRQRSDARQAVYKLTRLSPEQFVDMYLWRETYLGNLESMEVYYSQESHEQFMDFHAAISGREWMLRGCTWMIWRR